MFLCFCLFCTKDGRRLSVQELSNRRRLTLNRRRLTRNRRGWRLTDGGWPMTDRSHSPAGALRGFECPGGRQFSF